MIPIFSETDRHQDRHELGDMAPGTIIRPAIPEKHVRVPVENPESVAAFLEAAYFDNGRRTVMKDAQEELDLCADPFLLVTELILRSLRPVWWVHEGAKGRWKAQNGKQIRTWYMMSDEELQRLLNARSFEA